MSSTREIIHRQRIFEAFGTISDILSSHTALIQFDWNGKAENAVMKKENFYYNGRILDYEDGLDNFMSIGTEVKFTAHTVENSEFRECKWFVTICWLYNFRQWNNVSANGGITQASGQILNVHGRRGIIEFCDGNHTRHRVLFFASKFFINEKRFTGKSLTEVIELDETVSFDAIPCIPEENDSGYSWFSTCVYRGKRPNVLTMEKVDFIPLPSNSSTPIKPITLASGCGVSDLNSKDFKSQCIQLLDQCVQNPQMLFISGKGMIMDILNEEFGVLLGQFKSNWFEPILFYRRSVFFYQYCLSRNDLSQIFECGDHVKFIAVATPKTFPLSWIAVQVGIDESECHDLSDDYSQISDMA